MAIFKNNQFSVETNADHTLRCEVFLQGAEEHAEELGFRGTLVDDIANHLRIWKALMVQHEDEKGDVLAVTALINSIKGDIRELILKGRYLINSMLDEEEVIGITEHDIRKDFGVEGKIPVATGALINLGRQMAETNVSYIDKGSPYSLPEELFVEIGEKADELIDAVASRKKEKSEQVHVGRLKEIERVKGDRLLSRAFKWTVAVWHSNDVRLLELGFVPKSMIWTPGSGEPEPSPVDWPPWPGPAETFTARLVEPGVVELVYSGVQESTIGWLHRRKPGSEGWILVADDLPMTAEDIIPFRDYDVPKGEWEFRFIPMRGDEHGAASYAKVNVQ